MNARTTPSRPKIPPSEEPHFPQNEALPSGRAPLPTPREPYLSSRPFLNIPGVSGVPPHLISNTHSRQFRVPWDLTMAEIRDEEDGTLCGVSCCAPLRELRRPVDVDDLFDSEYY